MTSTALWVLNAAVLVTNAAILVALDPGVGVLVVLAVLTGLFALGSAVVARRAAGGGEAAPTATPMRGDKGPATGS